LGMLKGFYGMTGEKGGSFDPGDVKRRKRGGTKKMERKLARIEKKRPGLAGMACKELARSFWMKKKGATS